MIQPLDPSKELQAEAEDFALKRSKLSGQYPLTPSQQQRLKELQEKYKICFEPRLSPPTERTPRESFKIEVEPGATPVYRNYYRISPQQLDILREMLAEYVDSGKMDLCSGSSWGAPVILVPKKDKGWRIVFDYRHLNSVTIKDRYPLPRIDDYLQQLTGASLFSAFDALDGFHQLPMSPDSIEKTAVNTPLGSYVWKVMPMGLANAPAAFQRMMNRIFGHLMYAKVYMDDILVHSSTVESHFQHLEEFLSVCAANDIRLKASKCHFFYTNLEWIGFKIGNGQITPTETLTDKINRFPKPYTQKQNLAFLGLCNFYRRFIDRYVELSAPLVELNKKTYKQDFADYWNTECDQAFTQLRQALTSNPVLALYDPDLPTRVETDASNVGMGAVLTQCSHQKSAENKEWKPVEYYSRRWNSSQRNYHPAEKETCAIIYALQHWQHLLFGQPFTILTDNKVAHYLQTKGAEQLSQRDIRWMEKLQFFAPFEILYRPGNENVPADYLSRHPSNHGEQVPTFCILDLCAGMGTVLRALEIACNSSHRIDYIAVESDPLCRLVIQRVFNFVRLAAPTMFVRTDIFRLGNDVHILKGRRRLPRVDLVIAGVPCQPFSKANTNTDAPPLGLLDTRELFSAVRAVLDRMPGANYIIECTPFARHLDAHLQQVQEWFGPPQHHDMSRFSAQTRQRLVWTTISLDGHTAQYQYPELFYTWQECLDAGSSPPVDDYGLAISKCPTLMASKNSHSDRSKSTWVYNSDHELRPLTICEKERLTGMKPNDTQAYGVCEGARHHMCGNAFPVGWVAPMLSAVLRNSPPPIIPGQVHQRKGIHLYTQASRLLARHSLHVQDSTSVTTDAVGIPSNSATPEHTLANTSPTAVITSPKHQLNAVSDTTPLSLIKRIRIAAQADPEYVHNLNKPPSNYIKHLDLLFLQPQPMEANHGPAVLVIPADVSLRQELLHLVHDKFHFGQARTWAELRRHFYWLGYKKQCTSFVQQCPTCQLQKPSTRSRQQVMFPEACFFSHPFHTVVLDVVEGFPLSKQGHNAVITVVDKFTKFAVYIPIHTCWSAFRQATLLLDHVVYRYHCPTRIHTDNGPMYRKLFDAFCTALGIRHITGTPYHSQSQGGAERQHRTLLTSIRTMCNDKRDWDDVLQAAAHGYNDSIHAVIGYAPFELLYGCRSRLPWHLQLPSIGDVAPVTDLVPSLDIRVTTFLEKQKQIYQKVLELLDKQRAVMQQRRNNQQRTFEIGQQVKVQFGLKSPTDKHKLEPCWVGPFTVSADLGNGAYQLELPPGSNYSDRFNADRLAIWHDSDLSLFPTATLPSAESLPVPTTDTEYPIRRYLLRDFSNFPTVRYWVESDSTTDRYFFIDETPTLLDDILTFEEANGALPEQGITPQNITQVQQHKESVYLQFPSPILENTWPFRFLPYQTRSRPQRRPPATLLHAVVQTHFTVDDRDIYYQGKVTSITGDQYIVLWTDGGQTTHSHTDIQTMLYDPVSAVYDFSATVPVPGSRESVTPS